MGWNAKWAGGVDSIKLCDSFDFLNEVVDALNERNTVVGESPITGAVKLGVSQNILNNIQGNMTDIMDDFVNHTDNSGDWEGQPTIPYWTEANLLTEIGAASRLPTPAKLEVSADWLYQQYLLLNLLRWNKGSSNVLNQQERRGKSDHQPNASTSYTVAISDYNTNSWVSGSRGTGGLVNITKHAVGNYECTIRAYRANFAFINSQTTIHKTVVMYVKGYDFYGELYGNYSPHLYSTAGLFNDAHTFSENNDVSNNILLEGDTPATWGDDIAYSAANSTEFAVYKFDGANGFTFKDW